MIKIGKTLDKIKKALTFKTEDDFSKPQQISGGNHFDVWNQLNVQEQIDVNSKFNLLADRELKKAIKNMSDKYLKSRTIQPYYLLKLQANYFCGTCKFYCNNERMKSYILLIIRAAFLFGRAGLFFDRDLNKYYPVYIKNTKIGIDGKYQWIEYGSIYDALSSQDGTVGKIKTFKLRNEQCNDLIMFKWGVEEISAWIIIWPFVQLQAMLLQMGVIQAFTYNKKFLYKIANKLRITDEIESWFDPLNPFIISLSEDDLSNKFEMIENKDTNGVNAFIEYYKEITAIYYHLFGRRINNDVKKERNVSDEVEASQENYDIVQSDWLLQFEIFINEINNLTHPLKPLGLKIGIVEQHESENEDDDISRFDNE